jgi:arylsulfatase A-like enzyme
MIRTPEWKYVHRFPDGPHELYDLQSDPGEETNRFGQPAHIELVEDLRARLGDWFRRFVTTRFDGSRLKVTGCGQRNRADQPDAFLQEWPPTWLAHREEVVKSYRDRYGAKH